MIPSTGPPYAMTRWVAQTQENYVSATPYNVTTRNKIHGFQATRQPAIWMGESGSIAIVPGVALEGNAAGIEWQFQKRGLPLDSRFKEAGEEIISPSYYAVELSDNKGGHILVEQSSSPLSSFGFQTLLLIQVFQPPVLPIFVSVSTLPMSLTLPTFTLMSPVRPSGVPIPLTEPSQKVLLSFLQSSKKSVATIQSARTISSHPFLVATLPTIFMDSSAYDLILNLHGTAS